MHFESPERAGRHPFVAKMSTTSTVFSLNHARLNRLSSIASRSKVLKRQREEEQQNAAKKDRYDKLVQQFECLDPENEGTIPAMVLYELMKKHSSKKLKDIADVENLVKILNTAVGEPTDSDPIALTFRSFKYLLTADLKDSGEAFDGLQDLSTALFEAQANCLVAEAVHIESGELSAHNIHHVKVKTYVEYLVGVVICLNTITIGASIGSSSYFLDVCEYIFTAIFTLELVVKLVDAGPFVLYFCHEWKWNLFDTIIVALAWVNIIFVLTRSGVTDISNFSLLRLFRLLRLARLVRLIRMFKELSLIVQGLLGGLSTLFWALVLYAGFAYTLAVLLTQAMKHGNDYEVLSVEDSDELFGSVLKSMWTVFRCLSGDCQTHAAYPLTPLLEAQLGTAFPILYMIVYIVISFGLFNLIMAVLVENTLRAAKFNYQKIAALRHREDVRLGQKLKKLVRKLCQENSTPTPVRAKTLGRIKSSHIMKMTSRSLRAKGDVVGAFGGNTNVSREVWFKVISDPDVQKLVEDLGIAYVDFSGLYEILDADGNGKVDAKEIVRGILKVRGEARRGDVIAIQLALRAVQCRLRSYEQQVIRNQQEAQEVLEQLAADQARLIERFKCHEKDLSKFLERERGALTDTDNRHVDFSVDQAGEESRGCDLKQVRTL